MKCQCRRCRGWHCSDAISSSPIVGGEDGKDPAVDSRKGVCSGVSIKWSMIHTMWWGIVCLSVPTKSGRMRRPRKSLDHRIGNTEGYLPTYILPVRGCCDVDESARPTMYSHANQAVAPLRDARTLAKAERARRPETAGRGWFDLPATQITDEVPQSIPPPNFPQLLSTTCSSTISCTAL